MGWGISSTENALALKGGDTCPTCGKGTLCQNGGVAMTGHRIVTCHHCNAVLCARCKRSAQKQDTPQGEKYSCACRQ